MDTKCILRKLIHKDTELEFSKVIIPKKMRSVYWKYYGFPADATGNIVTRDTIICTLCSKAIAYNKNTTNLRTHLTSKHSEVLPGLQAENELRSPKSAKEKLVPAKTETNVREPTPKRPRRKIEIVDANDSTFTDTEPEKRDQHNSEMYNYHDYTSLEEPSFEVEEVNISVMNIPSLRQPVNLAEQIQEMIITDLLPPEFIEGSGFLNLMYMLLNNANIPRSKEIETNITNCYEDRFKSLLETLKTHSELKPFVLGFEIWRNVEEKNFASIYVNNVSRDYGVAFQQALFCTVELDKFTDFEETFAGINLKNCSAAVVTTHNPMVDNFLSSNDIPTIPCFDAVVNRALSAVFNLNSVSIILSEMSDLFEKHSDLLSEVNEVPQINRLFPWTRYNQVNFFHENVISEGEPNELVGKIRELVNCLNPLKAARDTLLEEANALSSLIKPLTKRLLQQHFCSKSSDSLLTAEIKDTINRELSKSVLSNDFLTVSAFLDPRFFKFLEPGETNCAKRVLEDKSSTVMKIPKSDFSEKTIFKPSSSTASSTRKSGLKMFFETSSNTNSEENTNRSMTVEIEINKYRSEANADLECDPLIWWNKFGYDFEILNRLAECYNCAPCCVNKCFRQSIEEQTEFSNRRAMLKEKIANQILFLHYNKKL